MDGTSEWARPALNNMEYLPVNLTKYATDLRLNSTMKDCRSLRFLSESSEIEKYVISTARASQKIQQTWDRAYSEYFPALSLYGEGTLGLDQMWEDARKLELLTSFLPTLQHIVSSVDVLARILVSLLRNIDAKFRMGQKHIAPGMIVNHLIDCCVSCLSVILSIHEVIRENDILQEHWFHYQQQMLSTLTVQPNARLMKMLTRTHAVLFETDPISLVLTLLKTYETFANTLNTNRQCLDHFLKRIAFHIPPKAGNTHKTNKMAIGSFGLLAIIFKYSSALIPESFGKILVAFIEKTPVVPVYTLTSFSCIDYLESYCTPLINNRKHIKSSRATILQTFDATIVRFSMEMKQKYNTWIGRMETTISSQVSSSDLIRTRVALYMRGLDYAEEIIGFLGLGISEHLESEKAISKAHIPPLLDLIVTLEDIQRQLDREVSFIFPNMQYIIGNIVNGLVDVTSGILKKIEDAVAKKPSDMKIGTHLALVKLFHLNLVNIPVAGIGLESANVILMMMHGMNVVDDGLADIISAQMKNLRRFLFVLLSFGNHIGNEQLIFWNRELIPIYLDYLLEHPEKRYSLTSLASVINRVPDFLMKAKHLKDDAIILQSFQRDIMRKLRAFMDKLVEVVERNIRVQVHQSLTQEELNPFKLHMKSLREYVDIPPFVVLENVVHLKRYVMLKLSKIFYEMSQVNPRNVGAYESMKHKCHSLYKIELIPSFYRFGSSAASTTHSLSSFVENVSIVASKYAYLLNSQTFVDKKSKSKFVFTFGLIHVTDEINSNGHGIAMHGSKAARNYLKQLVDQFSSFCKSDYVRSIVSKEMRNYTASGTQKYDLKNVGGVKQAFQRFDEVRGDGQSSLSSLCSILKSIGSMVAFDRLLMNALQRCRNLSGVIEDIEEDIVVDGRVARMQELLVKSQKDRQLDNTLVDSFDLQSEEHLKNIYILAPALIVNMSLEAVEYRGNTMNDRKNDSVDVFISDDSLCVGLVFVLSQLKQLESFDLLDMFDQSRFPADLPMPAVGRELKQQSYVIQGAQVLIK